MTARSPLFATTHWSLVAAAGDADAAGARAALDRLCRAYWYPIYAYVRRRGHAPHDAQDLTQAFFLQLLENRTLARADPRRGRFRAFLLVTLGHFLAHEWRRSRARKRGGDRAFLPWEELRPEELYRHEAYARDAPDALFERRWALALVDRAVRALREEFAADGRADLFDALKGLLTGDRATEPYAAVALRLGLTEAAVKMTVVRMRRRFAAILREEVAHTVADEAGVADELRHLLAVLSAGPAE